MFLLFISSLFTVVSYAQSPQFKKVIYLVFENASYRSVIVDPNFAALTKYGALFTHFNAETHPSQPNYIAMIAGSPLQVIGDSSVTLSANHLGTLLNNKELTWKAYAEDYPSNCFLGSTSQNYARKHVPFLSFTNVQKDLNECQKIVTSEQFFADYQNQSLPAFSMFIPNLIHDGHNSSVAVAGQWLADHFKFIFLDESFMKNTLVILTFDESENLFGKNQIYTLVLGANVKPGSSVDTPLNHYSLLKLIEDTWELGNLGRNDRTATAIKGIWN